jgi:hypothetical protein
MGHGTTYGYAHGKREIHGNEGRFNGHTKVMAVLIQTSSTGGYATLVTA